MKDIHKKIIVTIVAIIIIFSAIGFFILVYDWPEAEIELYVHAPGVITIIGNTSYTTEIGI